MLLTFYLLDDSIMSMLSLIFTLVLISPRSEEAKRHVMDHCLAAFVVMSKLLHIKSDNGLGYTATAFKAFCSSYKIFHTIGIPYNPQGQAIVE
jgi:hypothetical protein